jgi:hypothetical protein
MQFLASVVHPVANEKDAHHSDEKVMQYPTSKTDSEIEYVREGIQVHDQSFEYERTGVTHLVHAWHAQGHKVTPTSPSFVHLKAIITLERNLYPLQGHASRL